MADHDTERIPCFCALCVSRCGAIATVADGRFVALDADPEHPTGQALCLKGKVAPEIVYHPKRLLRPLKRTRPKGDADPGWVEIGWNEALDTVAATLRRIAAEHGPEAVVFATASPSTSALSDAQDWVVRLRRAYGSPNHVNSMELCGWGRHLATTYTFGAPVPGAFMPDLERAGCILFWGYNPSLARIIHATAAVTALNRGAQLVVVDPRRAGLAHRATQWLRVRPGTDTALALSIAHVMIERGWFDRNFVRDWTNAPLLVREDNGRLLREEDIDSSGDADKFVAWDAASGLPVAFDPKRGVYDVHSDLALGGNFDIPTPEGSISCRPVFALLADLGRPEEESDFYYVPADDPETAVARIVDLVKTRIPQRFGFDPVPDIQVLCPMNRGGVGARSLNIELQAALNPAGDRKVERFGWTFAPGDKVMQIENDYDKEVYNGDIGYIEQVDPEAGEVTAAFDGRTVSYGFGELDLLVPAYAATIHKSQGSEYPAIVIPLLTQHYPMLQRNLLYTGVTRGKRLVVLVGQKKAVAIAVRNVSGRRRWSKLRDWLMQKPTANGKRRILEASE
jgi:hypothetical protein